MSIGTIRRAHRIKQRTWKVLEEHRKFVFEELSWEEAGSLLYSLDIAERNLNRISEHTIDAVMKNQERKIPHATAER